MKTKLLKTTSSFYFSLFTAFFLLFSSSTDAQDFEWKWAMKGGTMMGGPGGTFSDEQIYDIKVGTDNNYYFIATMIGTLDANLNDEAVSTYNTSLGGNDIFIFSTTCDGEVRWSQAIGGGGIFDQAYNLVLDSDNNVYVGATLSFGYTNAAGDFPVHFSDSEHLPISMPTSENEISDFWKTSFLVKYDSEGNYIDRKTLQGDITRKNCTSQISDLVIDNQGKIHFIVGLMNGTHLDGNVTVSPDFDTFYKHQYYLATYNTNLEYESSVLLPFDGDFIHTTFRFAYDLNKNQHYIAGMRSLNVSAALIPLSYQGKAFVERSFILAIDGTDGHEKWRREIYSALLPQGNIPTNYISSLIIDDDSNVYIGGLLWRTYDENTIKIYDPTDPTNLEKTFPIEFTSNVWSNLYFVTKFNSDGNVQWAKLPSNFAPGRQDNSPIPPKGLAINGNEIALGTCEINFEWDGLFIPNLPNPYRGDPTILRLNKDTGSAIALSRIPGNYDEFERLTAVAVDNDGNYITGGTFSANLLWNNDLGLDSIISTGQADFFVAKLASIECGSGNMGTENACKTSINLFPNPTTGIVNIETSETLAGYTIYDMSGRQIQKGLFLGNNQIDLHNESKGVYFIKITTLQGTSNMIKVIKK